MPVALTYPGVYVEEIPSGVRTITGVATSITVFVGWAAKGPTDRAELVLSFSDFERKFGGLDARSLLGYSVSHFFSNGGQRAYILRLTGVGAVAGTVTLDNKLKITAIDLGEWSKFYAIVTKKRTDDPTRFQLKVVNIKDDPKGATVEVFEDLSMAPLDRRFVVNVLKAQSLLVSAELVDTPDAPPEDTAIPPKGDPKAGEIPESAKLQVPPGADGAPLTPGTAEFAGALLPASGTGGVNFLDRVDLFNILCIPGLSKNGPVDMTSTLSSLEKLCSDRRAILIVDSDQEATFDKLTDVAALQNLTGLEAKNAAFYFPWIIAPDPLQQNRPREFPPCGFVAGLYARTDTTRGVWKAPAGTDASLTGVLGVKTNLTDAENGVLNPKAINCIRTLPVFGTVLWGARTLQGNDEQGSEWKYIPVRRTALYIEESLFRGLKWVVFEPNDEPLWAQIRLNVGAFMHDLFRQGAFQGQTPRDAYFVKCDKETTTQNDINRGIVNIVVGFAPLKPAEFVIIKLQQIAGQIEV
jgi:hypothetical protein